MDQLKGARTCLAIRPQNRQQEDFLAQKLHGTLQLGRALRPEMKRKKPEAKEISDQGQGERVSGEKCRIRISNGSVCMTSEGWEEQDRHRNRARTTTLEPNWIIAVTATAYSRL